MDVLAFDGLREFWPKARRVLDMYARRQLLSTKAVPRRQRLVFYFEYHCAERACRFFPAKRSPARSLQGWAEVLPLGLEILLRKYKREETNDVRGSEVFSAGFLYRVVPGPAQKRAIY